MTVDEFTYKYNGRYVDFDGRFGCQCVDLIRCYLKECQNLDPYCLPGVSYAKEFYTKFNPNNNFYSRVANTPTNVPKKGDIVVWGYYPFVTGWAGHIAIFDSGDIKSLITFDQNYPTGKPCQFTKHSYRGVLGWLARK